MSREETDARAEERTEAPTAKRTESGDEQRLTTADLVREADEVDTASRTDEGEREPLFAGDEAEGYRGRWSEIQAAFVDEPRKAVEDADGLVAELMQKLAETFSDERSKLEQQWDRDGDVSTEDLRIGLQRYRSFFDRLLSA
jgi:hypothetical protein